MDQEQKHIARDAAIFALKLWIDSIKDIVLAFAGLGAAAIDILHKREDRKYNFYKVMRTAEKIDRALDVYGAKHPDEIQRGN